MKLSALLAQYLYANKRLDLPGLGSFLLKEPVPGEYEHHKHDKHAGTENLSFESNTAIKQSPELIQFIAEQTGKIKALASADLESHLALAKQFLNIGNPFLFEGIGILEKIRSGEFALTSGAGMHEKIKDTVSVEKTAGEDSGEFHNDYKKIFYAGKATMNWKKPFVISLVVAGLALAVWGGYIVYKKTKAKNNSTTENKKTENVIDPAKVNTDTMMSQKDSTIVPVHHAMTGMQKFILEVCSAKRAYERYGRLKTFQWDVQMETKDSLTYKLFLLLPASAADTSRIIDSLSRLNGRRVFIEQ